MSRKSTDPAHFLFNLVGFKIQIFIVFHNFIKFQSYIIVNESKIG
jgi:hypothetical protein